MCAEIVGTWPAMSAAKHCELVGERTWQAMSLQSWQKCFGFGSTSHPLRATSTGRRPTARLRAFR